MKRVSLRKLWVLLFSLLFVLPIFAGEQLGGYHLLKKVPLERTATAGQREYFE